MKKQKGFVLGVEVWAIAALLMAGSAVFNLGDKIESVYQSACEGAGYEWSSNPTEGCSGLPRKDG